MLISGLVTIYITQFLISWALIWQTLEWFKLRPHWQAGGVWDWSLVRRDYSETSTIWLKFLDVIQRDQIFGVLLFTQAIVAIVLLVNSTGLIFTREMYDTSLFDGVLMLYLAVSYFLVLLRFRGRFNGGSDSMTLIILSCLSVAMLSKEGVSQKIALGYIGVHAILSYVLSGFYKLKQVDWRSGQALQQFLSHVGVYNTLSLAESFGRYSSLARMLTWAILLFECTFWLVFFDQAFLFGYLAIALVFHWLNFLIFGLNRFFWAWLASYPALVYLVSM